jgi:hypothetical protein
MAKRVLVINIIEINKVEEIIQLVIAPKDYRKVIKKPKTRLSTNNNTLKLKKSSNREA